MSIDKVVITELEVNKVSSAASATAPLPPKLPSPVPPWARVVLSFLVLFLPVLCIVAIILRIAFRGQNARVKLAWTSFLSTLLIVGGFLCTMETGLVFAFVPLPSMMGSASSDLDERTQFPDLPRSADLNSAEVSSQLKPLVVVVSPSLRLWNHREAPSTILGAGMLLHADKDGYLIATAKHVADAEHGFMSSSSGHCLVATSSGIWSTAEVIAKGKSLDLALLWLPRGSRESTFVQPVHAAVDGENVFVIGHPEGLKFTLSTGIVSSIRDNIVQLSAPISPGNSGGPVYDAHGNLVAIVSAKFDRSHDVNAENLGFAVKAEALLHEDVWEFSGKGRQYFAAYQQAMKGKQNTTPVQ